LSGCFSLIQRLTTNQLSTPITRPLSRKSISLHGRNGEAARAATGSATPARRSRRTRRRIATIDTPTISRNMPFAQPCYRNNNRPFLDDTRGHDEPDRPNLSSTNYPVDYIRNGTRKSLEPAFVQSLVFFPTRLSIPTPAGLREIPASPDQQRDWTPK
jgi:nicotinamide riboside kinase